MGRHYVPQRYLQNFEARERPGFIWLHDKKTGTSHLAPIRNVAQASGYYSPETEEILAREVEGPANPAIEKLLKNVPLDSSARSQLTLYIAVMMKRVPFRRRKAMETYPTVLEKTILRVRRQIAELGQSSPDIDPDLVERRLTEVEAARLKFTTNPPKEIVKQIRDPWPSKRMLDAIYGMTWRVLTTSGPTHFITTDNPAFFFSAHGLATPNSEITFPLAPTHVLHGCWQRTGSNLLFLVAREQLVREVNRRLASAVERFAFSQEPVSWLHALLRKRVYLSVIKW